jgi:hypothetical protein
MTILIVYLAISLVMFYHEVLDSYRCKVKVDFVRSISFSLLWIVSIPFSSYLMWKELK